LPHTGLLAFGIAFECEQRCCERNSTIRQGN
jgi:hypothetical protein